MLSQLNECDVNGFQDLSGSFVVDLVSLTIWSITNEESNTNFSF